jgi:hypothetical protein
MAGLLFYSGFYLGSTYAIPLTRTWAIEKEAKSDCTDSLGPFVCSGLSTLESWLVGGNRTFSYEIPGPRSREQ